MRRTEEGVARVSCDTVSLGELGEETALFSLYCLAAVLWRLAPSLPFLVFFPSFPSISFEGSLFEISGLWLCLNLFCGCRRGVGGEAR